MRVAGQYRPPRTIKATVRAAVIARDGLTCRHCLKSVIIQAPRSAYSPDHLHLDHLIPWAVGGASTADNLVVSCAGCNLARPKPVATVRRRGISFCQDGDDYYWSAQWYRPPKRITYDDSRAFALIDAAELLELPPLVVLTRTAEGTYGGTTGAARPIRVWLAGVPDRYVDSRITELGWAA